jgi:hypothetical protein
MTTTETTTQHCCCHHHCPCLSLCGSSLCFGALAVAGNTWWQRMRTMVGAQGGVCELCVEFYFIAKLCFYVFASCTCGWGQAISPKRYICFYVFTFWKMCLGHGLNHLDQFWQLPTTSENPLFGLSFANLHTHCLGWGTLNH